MEEDLKNAIDTLRKGGIILYPTDTIWGLGCDATNKDAVEKIYRIKMRAESKSMLVLLDAESKLYNYVEEVPDMAFDLIELSEKPLTVIYPHAINLAENLIAEDKSIGIRVTKEEFSKTLCERFKKPIVSTSANVSGEQSPCFFDEISDKIKLAVDYVVHYRQEDKTVTHPSSIIKLGLKNEIKIIRE